MICRACKAAGTLIPIAGTDRNLIKSLHDQCPGGIQCDCQHKTETALRADRLPDPRRGA